MKTKEVIGVLDSAELEALNKIVSPELLSGPEAEAPYILEWASFQIKEKNVYRLKRTAAGWWYLKNIFFEVKEKIFEHHPLRIGPGLWYFDEDITIKTRRHIIFIWEFRNRFIPRDIERNMIPDGLLGHDQKAEEGMIINIDNLHHLTPVNNEMGEYLGTIAPRAMMLDQTFKKPSDEQRVILEKLGQLFPEQESSEEEITAVAEKILAKSYDPFDQAVANAYSDNDVAGIHGYLLNHSLVNPSKYRKIGMEVTGSGKSKQYWHIVVRIPEPNKAGLTVIICPKIYMGMIIGKNGQTVKKIESEFSVSIRVVEYDPEKK